MIVPLSGAGHTNILVEGDEDGFIRFGVGEKEGQVFEFANSGYVYALGFGENDTSPLQNLYRACATMLKTILHKTLEVPHSRNFVNGGTYGSGFIVEEAIIYTPNKAITYKPYKYSSNVEDHQAIFTFCGDLKDRGAHYDSTTPVITICDERRAVQGVRVQENGHHYFDKVLGSVWVGIERDKDFIQHRFKDVDLTNDAVTMVRVNGSDLFSYMEILATLIKQFYYDGLTYTAYQEKLLNSVCES
jgi:hypothetical protein